MSSKNQSPVVCASEFKLPPTVMARTPRAIVRVVEEANSTPSKRAFRTPAPAPPVLSNQSSRECHVPVVIVDEADPTELASPLNSVKAPVLSSLMEASGVPASPVALLRVRIVLAAEGSVATFI